MSAGHCPNCEINFPYDAQDRKCPICGEDTRWRPYATPDSDWQEKVDAASASEKLDFSLSKENRWRYDRLLKADFTETQAMFLALDRSVDLQKAEGLAAKAGPQLAFRILS